MKRNQLKLNDRKKIVRLCAESPNKGFDIIDGRVQQLRESKSLTCTVKILSDIFCVSEATIWADFIDR